MLIFILYVVMVVGFALLGAFLYFRFKKLEGREDPAAMTMLNQNVQGMQTQVGQSINAMNERLTEAAKQFSSLQRDIGQFQEIGRSMKELQDFLKSPKLRGNVGEQVMKDLLSQMLPRKNFELQYGFRSGDKVDAIIRTKNGLIPIDSKFPAENYQKATLAEKEEEKKKFLNEFGKDVRKHITSIARKYILPAEGTVDFALMYVPSESIYYEIISNTDLHNFGSEQKVYLVSPNTFYYFMQTVLLALSGEDIEKRAKMVLQDLRAIQQESKKFGTDLSVLNRHVTNAKGMMDTVNTGFSRLGARIDATGRLQEATVEQLETPAVELVEGDTGPESK
jgi:DNA recombination protein RmuC